MIKQAKHKQSHLVCSQNMFTMARVRYRKKKYLNWIIGCGDIDKKVLIYVLSCKSTVFKALSGF